MRAAAERTTDLREERADYGLPSLDHALLDKPFTPASLIAAVAALLGAAKAGLR